MLESPVECCECALPIGDDGALRAVLLIPCQHLLHWGCVDYIRRRRRLRQAIAGGEGGGAGASVSQPEGDMEDRNCGRVVACPTCALPVVRLVPLFPSSSVCAAKTGEATNVAARYKKVRHVQKSNIARLRELGDARARVALLQRTCALMHERLSQARAEAERLAEIFPAAAPATHVPRLVGSELCVKEMTATELELYILHSSATLEELEREVSEQRKLAEKKRRKLSDLRLRCNAAKEFVGHLPHPAKKQGDAESSASEVDCNLQSSRKRPRPSLVFEVEEEELTAEAETLFVLSRNSSIVKENENNEVDDRGSCNNDDDVVLVEQTEPVIRNDIGIVAEGVAFGGHSHANRGTRHRGSRVNATSNGSVVAAGNDGGEDDVLFYNNLWCVAALQHSGMHAANARRLLPRREDGLWQPSLEHLL